MIGRTNIGSGGDGNNTKLFYSGVGTSTFAVNNDKDVTNLNFGIYAQNEYMKKKFLVTKIAASTTVGISGGTPLSPGSVTVQGATLVPNYNEFQDYATTTDNGYTAIYQFIIIPTSSYVQISTPTTGRTQAVTTTIFITQI